LRDEVFHWSVSDLLVGFFRNVLSGYDI
jgi:hypothetical protein